MANQQGALSDPDPAACDPATDDIVDIEFDILDVESQILDVATALAERARMTSLRDFLLPPERLAALSPANRLKLLRMHLSRIKNRLAQDSPSAPRQNEQDRRLEGSTPDSASPASAPRQTENEPVRRLEGSASAPRQNEQDRCLEGSTPDSASAPRQNEPVRRLGGSEAPAPAPAGSEPKVPPLPPCTFSVNTHKCYVSQVTAFWNFLVTACRTRLDSYKSKATGTVKKQLEVLNVFSSIVKFPPASSTSLQEDTSILGIGSSHGLRCLKQRACRMQRAHPSTR